MKRNLMKKKKILLLLTITLIFNFKIAYAEEFSDGTYIIQGTLNNSKVIDLSGANTSNGSNIQLYQDNDTNAQKWIFTKQDDGYYRIASSINQNKVFDITYGLFTNSSNIQLYDANNTNAQKWNLVPIGNEIYTIKSIDNNYCLDLKGGGTSNGTNVQLYQCNNTNAQKFKLIKITTPEKTIEDGTYTIGSILNPNKVIDVSGGSQANYANVQLYEKNNTNAQKWIVKYLENGYYSIHSKLNKQKCLDVNGASFTGGTNVQLYDCNNTDAQTWIIKDLHNGYYQIMTKKYRLALDLNGAGSTNGTNVQIYYDNGTNAQIFQFTKIDEQTLESGIYTIKSNHNRNKVIDVTGGIGLSNTNVQTYDDNNTNAQKWYFEKLANKNYYIKSGLNSNLYLSSDNNNNVLLQETPTEWSLQYIDENTFYLINQNQLYFNISNGNIANGTNVNLTSPNQQNAQIFYIEQTKINENGKTIANGYYTISSSIDKNKVIEVANGSKQNETNIQIFTSNNNKSQIWYFNYEENGYYSITSSLNRNTTIDLKGGNITPGNYVQLYKRNNTDAQLWRIKDDGNGSILITSKKGNVCLANSNIENGTNIQVGTCNNTNPNQLFKLNVNQTKKSYTGIDVSSYQGDIDWEKVANTNIDFVVIKLGIGDNWLSQDDKKFVTNVQNCEKYNIPYAVYLYSYAKNVTGSTRLNADSESATSEAEHVLRVLREVSYKPNLKTSVYIDMEEPKLTYLGKERLTNIASTFCENIEANGYNCGIYANKSWLTNYLDTNNLKNKYNIWLAEWQTKLTNHNQALSSSPTYNQASYKLWQFSENGKIDGIKTNVDLDLGWDIFD
ncbi:MAG: RICIN domain-containing protein [Bacilli bacterium]|nr:RICIN domain-containing protein [Bacilli bacterium]